MFPLVFEKIHFAGHISRNRWKYTKTSKKGKAKHVF
jgi:hypothetical protein